MKSETKRRIAKLKKSGFPTGSYFLGCSDPKDSDWVVMSSDWNSIVGSELGEFYYKNQDYDEGDFRCFFVDDEEIGLPLNFIAIYDSEIFQTWKIATRLIKRIPVRFLENKRDRVALFELLKQIVEGRKKPIKSTEFDDDIPF